MAKLILSALLISFLPASLSFAQETITLETYYPAPYGSYQDLEARNRFRMLGDLDGDGKIGLNDVEYLRRIISGPLTNDIFSDPIPNWVMDTNQDGNVDVADVDVLVNMLANSSAVPGGQRYYHIEDFFNSSAAVNSGAALTVSGGNVGIGITSPLALLQVGISPNPGLIVTSSGNTGIGTTEPSQRLEVIGTISIGPSASGVDIQKTSGNLALRPGSGSVVRILNYLANRYIDIYNESGIASIRTGGGTEPFTIQVNGSEKMRIQNDGNVGIGSNAPLGRLQVGGAPSTPIFMITTAGNVGIGNTGPTQRLVVAGGMQVDDIVDTVGDFIVYYPSASVFKIRESGTAYQMDLYENGGTFNIRTVGATFPLVFQVNVSEKMRIQNDGNVGIGTNAPLGLFQVGASPTPGLAISSAGNVGIGTTAGAYKLYVRGDAYVTGNLLVAGTAYKAVGTAWNTPLPSDIRLKKNIQPLENALAKLLRLRGVQFEWKDPEKQHDSPGSHIGMIAQEVEKVFPDWVSEDSQGYKLLSVRGFEALTIEALRRLESDNQELKKQIGILKNENQRLRLRLNTLEKKVK